MEKPFLSQEEIDVLLKHHNAEGNKYMSFEPLSEEEKDTLCEIGNISTGASSTVLSELLGQKVTINVPILWVTTLGELHGSFQVPYILVEVNYTSGLSGKNLLLLKTMDAAIIADIMMGGTGENPPEQLDEYSLSALSEAMNQMIGFSATSMSEMFQRKISISPPTITTVSLDQEDINILEMNQQIVVICFQLKVGQILQSEIMLLMEIEVAKKEVEYLFSHNKPEQAPQTATPAREPADSYQDNETEPGASKSAPSSELKDPIDKQNLNLILDIPLKLSVVLGKTRKTIEDVVGLGVGSIVELEKFADEPVEIMVNGTLIARGEVVVVDEYFGVRITDIISPENRIKNLGPQKS
ncbi:MAG: flagellar motor switch phosphatase FliY [Syntrophomonadaceae bacterium]